MSALLDVLIQKLLSMDSTDVPHLCCDFKRLSRIPKFGIEDVTDIALLERIQRLEVKLLQLDHTVCEHSESLLAPVTVTMVKKPSNNIKPQKSKTKNNINLQLPKSATGGNVHATDALKHPATVPISMSATSTNTNLDIFPETTPGNASGQSSRDVSPDPTIKTLGPSSGSTPASNSKAITGSISGSKPDNSPGSDDTDEHDDAVRTQAKHEAGIRD